MDERFNVPTWDETFMNIASIVRLRSKDPATQVGACIVSQNNRILSLGYNGAPNGFDDKIFPWGKHDEDVLNTKYPYVVHAERNAILNFRGSLSEFNNAKLYVTHYPCNECAKEIIQTGINEVIYLFDPDISKSEVLASQKMFKIVGVKTRHFRGIDKHM